MRVALNSVTVDYRGEFRAVDGITFDIADGQFVSLVGPSGCGKSTLLRLAAGLLKATAGDIEVGPAKAPLAGRGLAYVFQDATLLPWRSVRANVRLPLELERVPRIEHESRVRDCLAIVGLSDFARRYPRELSGGMRMRVSLARALATRPRLMLLDEPFGALDDLTRQTLNDELHALWLRERFTALFVTHNIAEAVFLSQRVLVMSPRPGRIVADVPIPFDSPRVANLRGSPEFAELAAGITRTLMNSRP